MGYLYKNHNGAKFVSPFHPKDLIEKMQTFIDDVYYEKEGPPLIRIGRDAIQLDGGPRFRISVPLLKAVVEHCRNEKCEVEGELTDADAEFVGEVEDEADGVTWGGAYSSD